MRIHFYACMKLHIHRKRETIKHLKTFSLIRSISLNPILQYPIYANNNVKHAISYICFGKFSSLTPAQIHAFIFPHLNRVNIHFTWKFFVKYAKKSEKLWKIVEKVIILTLNWFAYWTFQLVVSYQLNSSRLSRKSVRIVILSFSIGCATFR